MENKKSNKLLFIILGTIAGIVVLAISTFVYFKTTPYYSLLQIRKATQQRDYPLFEKYVDVDSVIDNAFVDSMDDTNTEDAGMFAGLLSGLIESAKNTAKTEFRTAIEGGDSADSLYSEMTLINLLTKLEIEKHGKTADIILEIDSRKLSASMRNESGTWRIFKIDSLEDSTVENEISDNVSNIIEKGLGEEVTLATITIKANKAEKLSELPSGFGDATKPSDENNVFLKLNLTIKNLSSEEMMVGSDMVIVADSQDNQYEMQSLYLLEDSNQLYYESINPNLAKTGNVYFEIPKSSEGFYLPIIHRDTGDNYKILLGL